MTIIKTLVKYILINVGFISTGFLLSYVVDLGRYVGLSDPIGLGNFFLMNTAFAIMGLIFTGYIFYENKVLRAITLLGLLCLIYVFYSLVF